MKIPRHIYNILNDKREFDYLFLFKMRDCETMQDAYDAAVNHVREYLPNFKEPYKGFDNYRCKFYLEMREEVDVPDDVVNAAINGINDLFYQRVNKFKVYKLTYDNVMGYIHQYLPNFNPYKSYESYRNSYLYKRKVEIKKRKRK